jgi:cysteine desulfurase
MIYLDNNATTHVTDEVLAAMEPYYRELYGNAHAMHALGRRSHEAVEEARSSVARLLDCSDGEVIFTSCGTEGNALVIRGLIDTRPSRRRIVTTAVEHPSVMLLLRALEQRGDVELAIVNVDRDGALDMDQFRTLVDDRTLLISVMLAQNETGVIHPIAEICELAHAHGALLHVDAVQAAGKIPISHDGIDFMTISGHKLHAPKGIGALSIHRGRKLTPLWYGGGQELGMRSGTEAVPSIVGFGVAARMALEAVPAFECVRELRDRFESELRAKFGVQIAGALQPRLPNTSSVIFRDHAAEVVAALDAHGVCVSAGAACNTGLEPSATMKAMGLPAAVRFSLSRFTTASELDEALAIVEKAFTK